MRNLIITTIILLSNYSLFLAQKETIYLPSYREDGTSYIKKHECNSLDNQLYLEFDTQVSKEDILSLFRSIDVNIDNRYITDFGNSKTFICLIPKSARNKIEQIFNLFQKDDNVGFVSRFYTIGTGKFVPKNKLFLSPLEDVPMTRIESITSKYSVQIEKARRNGTYYIVLPKNNSPLEVAAELYETGLFRFCEPNKLHLGKITSADDYTDDQWHINASSGTADTKIDDAWAISGAKHGDGIEVAVIDDGVRWNHPDLINQLVTGSDEIPVELGITDYGVPGSDSYERANGHGTSVAGIIAAEKNSFGADGVAYNAKIKPIRVLFNAIFYDEVADEFDSIEVIQDDWLANGFYSARLTSDIINCSLELFLTSSLVDEEIEDAYYFGRSTLGIPMFSASGNDGISEVDYPALHPLVIAVGATSDTDNRSSFSNYGSTLDIVAPGENITTTDITGTSTFDWDGDGSVTDDLGYNGGDDVTDYFDVDYTNDFSGTSASSPVAAGVMALMLSNNPSLQIEDAREILESTCYKSTSYTFSYSPFHTNGDWNNEVGYGRINAYDAVNEVLSMIEEDELGGTTESVWGLQLLNLNTFNTGCYSTHPDYSPGISLTAKANVPFDDGYGNKFMIDDMVDSDPNLSTDFYYGGTFPVEPYDEGGYFGIDLAEFIFATEPSFPYSEDVTLRIGADDPLSIDPDIVSKPFTLTIHGINILLSDDSDQICSGSSHTLSANISGSYPPFTYTYQRKQDGMWIDVSSPQTIPSSAVVSETLGPLEYVSGTLNEFRVKVTNSEGCSRKSSTFELDVSNIAVDQTDFDACLGSISIPLDIGIHGGIEPYNVSWSPGTYLSDPTAITPVFDPTGAATTDYWVTISDDIGCLKAVLVNVEVHPYGTLTLTASADPDTVCRGGSSELSAICLSGVGSFNSWTWTDEFGNELQTSESNLSYNTGIMDETSHFTYTVIDAHNCAATSDITVTVDPGLGPKIEELSYLPYCPGLEIEIDPTILLPTGGYVIGDMSYEWSSGETTSSIYVDEMVTSDYELKVSDPDGCYDTETFTILRDETLGPNVVITWDNEGVICPGEIAELTANVSGGTDPYIYEWDTGETSSSISLNSEETTTSSVVIEDASGCLGEDSISLPLNKLEILKPHPDGISPDQNFNVHITEPCIGDLINTYDVFSDAGGYFTGGASPYTYEFGVTYWYRFVGSEALHSFELPVTNSFPIIEISTPSSIGLPFNAIIYSCTVSISLIDANGCVDETTNRIRIWWPPHGEFPHLTYEEEVCSSSTSINVLLKFFDYVGELGAWGSSNGPLGVTTYYIVDLDAPDFYHEHNTLYNLLNHQWVEFPGPGLYRVVYTITTDCGSETFIEDIEIGAYIGIPVSPSISVCELEANSTHIANNKVVTDDTCNVTVNSTDLVEYIAGKQIILQPGFHSVNGSDYLGRIDECLLNKAQPVHSEKHPFLEWKVYPNPSSGLFTVELANEVDHYELSVFNVIGKKLFSKNISEERKIELDLSSYPSGIYLIGIQVDIGKTLIKKIVIN